MCDRLEQFAGAVCQEQLSFVRKPVTEDSQQAARPVDEAVLARGVTMRTVFVESVRRDPTTMMYARWLDGTGAEVRTSPVLPLRMVVYDRRVAVLPSDPDDSAKGAIVLRGTGIIVALVALFEQVWSTADPVCAQVRVDEDGLRPTEQELLRQLAEGATDEAAARRLGVSLRTVRRIMGKITERLGARGRFQTAVRAMERGWL